MSVVGSNLVCQVGFIVKDIYATKKKWAEFLGVEEPEANLCGEYEIMQTEYMGAPGTGGQQPSGILRRRTRTAVRTYPAK